MELLLHQPLLNSIKRRRTAEQKKNEQVMYKQQDLLDNFIKPQPREQPN